MHINKSESRTLSNSAINQNFAKCSQYHSFVYLNYFFIYKKDLILKYRVINYSQAQRAEVKIHNKLLSLFSELYDYTK